MIQTPLSNGLISNLFYILKPANKDELSHVVGGNIGLVLYDSFYAKVGMAYDESETFFSNRFVTLDTHTGIMCFHTSEFGECLEEVDLKMAVAICDLNQKMNQIVLNGNKKVTWAKNSKVIAVHNGSKCYLFLFNKDEFQKWAEAFKKVEIF